MSLTQNNVQNVIEFLSQPNYLPREQLNCEFLLAQIDCVIGVHREFMAQQSLRLVMASEGAVQVSNEERNISNQSTIRPVIHNASNVMMHSFCNNRGATSVRTISTYDRPSHDGCAPYPYHPIPNNRVHQNDSNPSNHADPLDGGHGRFPKYRPRVIRESDIPPRLRKRKAPRTVFDAPNRSG